MGAAIILILLIISVFVITNVILSVATKKPPQFSKPRTNLWAILGAVVGLFVSSLIYSLFYSTTIYILQPPLNPIWIYLSLGIISLTLGIITFIYGIKRSAKASVASGACLLGFTSIVWFFAIISGI